MRIASLLGFCLVALLPGVSLAQSSRPAVAVVQIDDLTRSGQDRTLATMIETAVAGTNKFRLIERARLGQLVGEQARARGGVVTTNTPGRAGGFEGVDYLIYGTITSLSASKQQNIGASLVSSFLSGSRSSSMPDCSNTVASLAVDIKITDADSGEIKYVTRINESQKAAATCGGNAQVDSALLLRSAAEKVAAGLVTAIYPIQVAAVQADGSMVLNYGEGALALGAVMAVYSKGEDIRDPTSGEVIGNNETKLGLVRVSEVTARMSKAVPATTFASAPAVGSIVRAASLEEIQALNKPAPRRRR